MSQYAADITAAKNVLMAGIGTAFLIGFVYMLVLKCFGGPIIWASLVALILVTGYGGFQVYEQWGAMDDHDENKVYYQAGYITIWVVTGLLLCCILCNCKNIKIAIAVFKCTTQFINGTPQVFLVPPLSAAAIVCWFLLWFLLFVYLASVGTLKPNEALPMLTSVEYNDNIRYALIYSVFGFLWIANFIIGVTQFIISAACAIWYFTSTSDANGSGSLMTGLFWVFRYHLGSIAFGAFIIALVQLIRLIFEYYAN